MVVLGCYMVCGVVRVCPCCLGICHIKRREFLIYPVMGTLHSVELDKKAKLSKSNIKTYIRQKKFKKKRTAT